MAAVAFVSLNPLTRLKLKEVCADFAEHFNLGILTSRVETLDPHQITCKDVDAQLVAQGRLPLIYRETKHHHCH